jgi:hypothetical protein
MTKCKIYKVMQCRRKQTVIVDQGTCSPREFLDEFVPPRLRRFRYATLKIRAPTLHS